MASKADAKASTESSSAVSPATMLGKLELGALVQVSSHDGSLKYLTRLVGADSTKTLITALPTPKQLKKETVGVVYDNVFFPEKVLVMRLIAQGSVFAFESEVVAVNYSGCKLLLSNFPKQIQSQTLRQDARYPCALNAHCQLEQHSFDGVMVDISNGGGQLHFDPKTLGLKLEALKGQNLSVDIRFNSEQQANNMQATIVTVQKIETQDVALGLAFVQPEQAVRDYLDSLQLGEMSTLFL